MQTRDMQLGHTATFRNSAKWAFPTNGLLLALDGRCLDRLALPIAVRLCQRYGKRLDILLVNPPKPATLMLGKFLQELEEEGVEYRLTSTEGTLAAELPLYVHHFDNISIVLLDCLDKREARLHSTLEALRQEGYRVLALLDRKSDAPLGNAGWKVAT